MEERQSIKYLTNIIKGSVNADWFSGHMEEQEEKMLYTKMRTHDITELNIEESFCQKTKKN
jgi:hypothetical protein